MVFFRKEGRNVRKKNILEITRPDVLDAKFEKTFRLVKKAITEMELTDEIEVRQILLNSPLTRENYGYLRNPTVILNGVIIFKGTVPTKEEIQEKFQEILQIM